jgi:hypothetical protein
MIIGAARAHNFLKLFQTLSLVPARLSDIVTVLVKIILQSFDGRN